MGMLCLIISNAVLHCKYCSNNVVHQSMTECVMPHTGSLFGIQKQTLQLYSS